LKGRHAQARSAAEPCLREYRGFIQQNVADTAGASRGHLSRFETGKRSNPSREAIEAIAQKLRFDPDSLG